MKEESGFTQLDRKLDKEKQTPEMVNDSSDSHVNIPKNNASSLSVWSIVWIIIASILALHSVWIQRRFLKKLKKTGNLVDDEICVLLKQCQNKMGIKKKIDLLECDVVTSPILIGYFYPTIVLPSRTKNILNIEQLRNVFFHELSHIKRHDLGLNWLMNLLLILHWFNPFLWIAYFKMREDQEMACDALAMNYIHPRDFVNYGKTIILLLESFPSQVACAGVVRFAGTKKQIIRRIKMIKQFNKKTYRRSLLGLGLVCLIGGVFLTNSTPTVATEDFRKLSVEEQPEATKSKTSTTTESLIESKTVQRDKSDVRVKSLNQDIQNIITLAKEGKVPRCPFGISTLQSTVETKWGSPDKKYDDNTVLFYDKKHVRIDLDGNQSINSLMFFNDSEGRMKINISDIEKVLGTPSDDDVVWGSGFTYYYYKLGKFKIEIGFMTKSKAIISVGVSPL